MNRYLITLILLLLPLQLPANEPVVLNDYAVNLMDMGNHDKALEQLQKAYSIYPYDLVLKKNLAEAYTFVGQRQMKENNFEAAAASFDRARELFPEIPRFYIMRGIALYYSKYPDAAKNELERARGIGGDSPDILFYLAKIEYDAGNLQTGKDFLEKALQLKSDFKSAAMLMEKISRELEVEKTMERGYSSRFLISYDGESRSHLASEILSTLEEAYSSVGRDLSIFPAGRIPVIIYPRKDFKVVTAGPDWSGGLYDGKIRIPLGGIQEMNDHLKSVLYHEYTHVAVQEITHGNCPTWLNEGLAVLQEKKVYNQQFAALEKGGKASPPLDIKSLEGDFTRMGNQTAALAYNQSYSLVNFMVTAYGWPKVNELLQKLGTGMKISEAMKGTMGDFGLDYDGVIQEWQGYLKKEHGR